MSSAKDKYRKIHMRMWGDKHVRALSAPQPNGQSLWVHLLAGSQTGIVPGLIASTELGMAGELRWDPEGFRKAFAEVSGEGGRKALAKADWKAGLVWVPNAIKFNPPQSPNVIVSWRQAWDELPECDLKTEAYRSLRDFVKGMGKGFQEAFEKHVSSPGESFPEASPNQEQEQEQDKGERASARPPEPVRSEPVGARPPLAQVAPDPVRFMQPLSDAVRAEFFSRRVTPQKAAPTQWRDGCQTVQDALELRAYPDAHTAIDAFAKLLVTACAAGEKLGFALQQVPLGQKLDTPPARQLSPLALKTIAAARGDS